MTFAELILENLPHQPVRTGLTLFGISLGIATVVALGVVTDSLKQTAGEILKLGGADFMVAQEGAADLSFSVVRESDVDSLAEVEGVERVHRTIFHVTRLGSNPFFFLIGRPAEEVAVEGPRLQEGRVLAGEAYELMLGRDRKGLAGRSGRLG